MKRIGLMSDTHGFLDERVAHYFDACDEIWHAGDIGTEAVADWLESFKPLRAVYGNIDGPALRQRYAEDVLFSCEGLKVWMIHIGGYPGRYVPRVKKLLPKYQPDLFVCGHSHILKVMPDTRHHLLHLNPGACGREGFHKVNTLLRFTCHEGQVRDLEVIELGPRGAGRSLV